jgi:hypothetical protein
MFNKIISLLFFSIIFIPMILLGMLLGGCYVAYLLAEDVIAILNDELDLNDIF